MSFFTDIAKLATFLAYLVFLSFLDKEFVYFFLPTREKRLQYFQSRQPQIYGLFSSWRIVCSNTLWLPSPPPAYTWLAESEGPLGCWVAGGEADPVPFLGFSWAPGCMWPLLPYTSVMRCVSLLCLKWDLGFAKVRGKSKTTECPGSISEVICAEGESDHVVKTRVNRREMWVLLTESVAWFGCSGGTELWAQMTVGLERTSRELGVNRLCESRECLWR